jgi:glycerophosphoryl diester phosphodiesterase
LTAPRAHPKRDAVRLLVIAHRGASGTCPENTLAAFRRAATIGAPMVELDVQLTRDHEVVVMHDWTLDRTTDGSGAVRDRTLAEIRRLDAGAWFGPSFRGERVPTLAEVLAEVPVAVNVELKPVGDDGLEDRALAVVEAAGALGRVVFSSFEAAALRRLRSRSETAALAVLWEREAIAEALALAGRVGARALHLRKDAVTPEVLASTSRAGLPVRAWTVNDPSETARLRAAGVAGIFTDFPERFLHTVGGA